MDPSKSRKPSLPRLTTNVPARRSSASLPLVPLAAANIDPALNKQPCGPTLFLDDKKDTENVAPILRYAADVKPPVVRQSVEEPPVTKTKTSYYEDAFAFRGAHNSPQERVAQDSIVVAVLTTNHKIKEDHRFLTDFLFRLAHIYQRPESSIMIVLQQDAQLSYGGSTSLRSYLLKIYALPSLIAPVTNQRNTTLIQDALQDLMAIPPGLGVIAYIPVPEENFATNGTTLKGEITRLERDEESPSLFKTISRGMSRRLKSNSGQSAPLSSGVTSPLSNPKSDPLKSPDITKATEKVMGETSGRSLRKRDSLRTLVRGRLMGKIQGKDDQWANSKESTVEKDSQGVSKDVSKEVSKKVSKEQSPKEETNVQENDY